MCSQVIGPFIDNPNLLFGDYTPDVMVLHSHLWCVWWLMIDCGVFVPLRRSMWSLPSRLLVAARLQWISPVQQAVMTAHLAREPTESVDFYVNQLIFILFPTWPYCLLSFTSVLLYDVLRSYKSSDVTEACAGANVAIVCLGTGKYAPSIYEWFL